MLIPPHNAGHTASLLPQEQMPASQGVSPPGFMMPGALSTRQGSRSGQICGVCSGEHTECGTSRYSGIMQYARVPDHLLTLLWKSLTSRRPIFEPLFKNPQLGLLGGPVAKTRGSLCRGPGFNPWSGN